MLKNTFCSLWFLLIFAVSHGQNSPVRIIKFNELEEIMISHPEKTIVINFWATWCAPCVKELPYFEEVLNNIDTNKTDIILINLDFASNVDKVEKFVTRKQLKNKVLLLDEIDYNSWIDKVSTEWSGAIPATLIIDKNNSKHFKEGEISKSELENLVYKHTQ